MRSRSSWATATGARTRRPQRGPTGRRAAERCALLFGGSVAARYAKHHLPNYGVFDEFRYFVRGDAFPVLRLHGVDVGMTICEDLWQEGGPVAVAGQAGVDVLVCINGSPYERGKSHTRDALAARRAREAGAYLAYVNTVGGQDELVFDGDSLAVDPAGNLLVRARQFDEELLVVDVDSSRADGDVTGPVDARDGTTMAVERITLAADPVAAYPAGRRTPSSRASTPTRSCTAQWSSAPATTSRRTASRRSCWGCPGGSIRRWSPRSRSTPSAPTRCHHGRDALALLLPALAG